ncbi:type IV secretion protein Rhs [Escherichia coli]|nr:type IV secretion protein Rhs [Escherichia coli]
MFLVSDPLGLAASSKISRLMDYIGDGRRVSGHTGCLDGVCLSSSPINNIAKDMEKLAI